MNEISSEDLSRLGLDHHRGRPTRCPNCGATLKVQQRPYLGKGSTDLFFFCPNCQRHGMCEFVDADDDWSDIEVAEMLEDYVKYGAASCPRDTAMLSISRDPSLGSRVVFVMCPLCGRDVQREPSLPTTLTVK